LATEGGSRTTEAFCGTEKQEHRVSVHLLAGEGSNCKSPLITAKTTQRDKPRNSPSIRLAQANSQTLHLVPTQGKEKNLQQLPLFVGKPNRCSFAVLVLSRGDGGKKQEK